MDKLNTTKNTGKKMIVTVPTAQNNESTSLNVSISNSMPECLEIAEIEYCQNNHAKKDIEFGMFVIGSVIWVVVMSFFIGTNKGRKAAVVFISGPLLFGLYLVVRGVFKL